MKITAVLHWYVPHRNAGSETMLHAMLSYLASRGHEVECLVTDEPTTRGTVETIDGVRVRSLTAVDVRNHIRSFPPHTMISHHREAGWVGKLAKEVASRFILVLHNDFRPNLKLRDYTSPDLVVYNTEWLAASVGQPKLWPGVVVRPPIDFDRVAAKPGDRITMVNIAREHKGGELFVPLAEALPDRKFLAVRGAYGVQCLPDVLPPNVDVVDNTYDISSIFSQTRILLAPSTYETFGMVAAEALSCGIPVLSGVTPGLLENLSYGATFVTGRSVGEWVRAIESVSKSWAGLSKLAKERSKDHRQQSEDDLLAFAERVETLKRRR